MDEGRVLYKYSADATRLANVSQDGRLIIWNRSSEIEQQYSPSSHLSTQITCLAWSPAAVTNTDKKNKKKDDKGSASSDLIALGTSAGSLLVYSVKQGDIVTTFDVSNHKVLCLTWSNSGKSVVCGTDRGEITICCVLSLQVLSRFKAGKGAIHALALTNDDKKIVAASQKIKVYAVHSQDLVQTFAGHSNPVTSLSCVQNQEGEAFVLSVAAEDRNVSVWKIDGEGAATAKKSDSVFMTLSANDEIKDVACFNIKGGDVLACASTESGRAAVFRTALEKSRKKPKKAFSLIQIMYGDEDKIKDVPVLATQFVNRDQLYINISYGSEIKLKIEELKISELRESHILARERPKRILSAEMHKPFTKDVPMKDAENVKYLMAKTTVQQQYGAKQAVKRPMDVQQADIPLADRLSTLQTGESKTNSYTKLLVQGIKSKNRSIILSVTGKSDVKVIDSTCRSLPVESIVPFLEILHDFVTKKNYLVSHVLWAQAVIRHHVGYLVSTPKVHSEVLLPLSDVINARTANFLPILKLKGKIQMIKRQMEHNRSRRPEGNQTLPLLAYQDESDLEEGEGDEADPKGPPKMDYDSDFLDEYLSDKDNQKDQSSDEEEDDDDEEMETNGATIITNGHGKGSGSEDEMMKDVGERSVSSPGGDLALLTWFPLATQQLRFRSISQVYLYHPTCQGGPSEAGKLEYYLTFHETALSSPFMSTDSRRQQDNRVLWPDHNNIQET